MDESIYRKEALEHRRNNLPGEVILHSHLSHWVITALLVAAAILAAVFLCLITVSTPQGDISLWTFLTQLSGPK